MTNQFIDKMRRLWKRSLLLVHEGEWIQSGIATAVFADAGGDKQKAYDWLGKIDVPSNSKAKLGRMAHARTIVPDKDVWTAAGWSGVRRLVEMPATERKKRIKSLRAEVEKGTKPKAAAAKVLPKPPAKPRETTKASTQPAPAVNRRVQSLLDTVLADLAKLAAFNPGILPLLSPEVRRAVERLTARTG